MSIENEIIKSEELVKSGKTDQAKTRFKELLELEPDNLRILNNLAVLAIVERHFEDAGTYLAAALAIDSDDLHLLHNALSLEMSKQDWSAARDRASAILAIESGSEKILKAAVKIEIFSGNYSQAAEQATLLLQYFPNDPEAIELSSLAYYKAGKVQESRTGLDKLMVLNPGREDVAARLALLNFPEKKSDSELWPDPSQHDPWSLSIIYHQTWAGIKTEATLIKAAQILGRLSHPKDESLSLEPPTPVDFSHRPVIPSNMADVDGMSIMFAPTIIAGQSAMMARWLKARGAKTTNMEMSKNYLGYTADYHWPTHQSEVPAFIQAMMQEAEKHHVLCLDFGSSFTYFPNFISRQDYRMVKDPEQPYADLLPLKEKGVKIFFAYWGSDCSNQSIFPYYYLKYLGFDDLPKPPEQSRYQYKNIMAADQIADAVIGCGFDCPCLPRFVSFREVCLEPHLWPVKKNYRQRVEKILTAPTNPRKKNYTLTQAVLKSVLVHYPEARPFLVQNTPHDQVAPLYADADIGIDQIVRSFGTFSVEMMALGLPVISSRHKHFTNRDMAPVLSFNNIRELADRLCECIENPGMLQELGRQGRDYAMEYHSINVGGRVFSHYLAEAVSGGQVPHVISDDYIKASLIWEQNPEEVYCFKFYDLAVPLMCALGEFEYGQSLCVDAMDCDYRVEKFYAWHQAINEVSGCSFPLYRRLTSSPSLDLAKRNYIKMLKDSKALFKEYEEMNKEKETLKNFE